MLAKFKINRIDDRYLIKNFTEMFESEIQLKMPCTIEYPVITLDVSDYPSWSEVNYVYIEELKRGYFIDSYTMKSANLVDYSLRVDVLTNLSNQIMAMTCMVERQEFIYSPYYVDNLSKERYAIGPGVDGAITITPPTFDNISFSFGSLVAAAFSLNNDPTSIFVVPYISFNIHFNQSYYTPYPYGALVIY